MTITKLWGLLSILQELDWPLFGQNLKVYVTKLSEKIKKINSFFLYCINSIKSLQIKDLFISYILIINIE